MPRVVPQCGAIPLLGPQPIPRFLEEEAKLEVSCEVLRIFSYYRPATKLSESGK